MIFPKCRFCGNDVDPKTGYRAKENKKYIYFCDEDEYHKWIDKNKQVDEICAAILETLGEVTTETSWKYIRGMVDDLSQSYPFSQILDYIKADSTRIYDILAKKNFQKNFEMVRYYIGIVKNSIGDYIKEQAKLAPRESKEVDIYMGYYKYKPQKIRRAMIEIEQLGDDKIE